MSVQTFFVPLFLRLLAPARQRPDKWPCDHHAMFAVDIAAYSRWPAHQQRRARLALYTIVRQVCAAAGLQWRRCRHEDRGDGLFVITATGGEIEKLLNRLPRHLQEALDAHNRTVAPTDRIRLRLAIHAGYIQPDANGITSPALNHLHRLLDAPELRRHLADHRSPLAVIVSDYLFENAASFALVDPVEYRPVTVAVKETTARAWIWTPDPPAKPSSPSIRFVFVIVNHPAPQTRLDGTATIISFSVHHPGKAG